MNKTLAAFSKVHPSSGGGQVRWSALFGTSGDLSPITLGSGVNVLMDLDFSNTSEWGYITLGNGSTFEVDSSKPTRFSCKGMLRQTGSTYLSAATYTNKHNANYTGLRSEETTFNKAASVAAAGTPEKLATPSYVRGCMGEAGSIRRCLNVPPAITIVKVSDTVYVGDQFLLLEQAVTWPAGVKLHLTSTKYYDEGDKSEDVFTTAAVNNSTTVFIARDPAFGGGVGARFEHYGKMQYVVPPSRGGTTLEDKPGTNLSIVDSGILSTDTFGTSGGLPYLGSRILATIAAGAPRKIDNRCTVFLMTMPYTITSPRDSDATTHGFNATDMTMGAAEDQRRGMGFVMAGKAGVLGAYPFHDHLGSITANGSVYTGDVNPATRYIDRCTVDGSTHRVLSVHATCGGRYTDMFGSRIDGTAYLLGEDGSEQRNTFNRLCFSGVNFLNTLGAYGKVATKKFDEYNTTYAGQLGPSGIWLTNPNNNVTNCIGSRAHVGAWNAFSLVKYRLQKGDGTLFGRTNTNENGISGTTIWGGTRTGSAVLSGNVMADIGINNIPRYAGVAGTVLGETITLTATSTTTFSVVGSLSGSHPSLTISGAGYTTLGGGWSIGVSSGTAVVGDTFVVPLVRVGGCWGLSKNIPIEPSCMGVLNWNNNEFHSSLYKNMVTISPVKDEAGNVEPGNDHVGDYIGRDGVTPEVFTRARLWKCGDGDGHYVQLALSILYTKWEIACHRDGPGIRGIVGGNFQKWLASGSSLDDAHDNIAKDALGFSYHNAVTRQDCIFIATPQSSLHLVDYGRAIAATGTPLETYDFYLDPIADFSADTNNSILGANPGNLGYKMPPVQFSILPEWGVNGVYAGTELAFQSFTPTQGGPGPAKYIKGNSSAFKLPADGGIFNATGWWVYCKSTDANDQFLTYGTTGGQWADSPTGYTHINGKVVSSAYKYVGCKLLGWDDVGDYQTPTTAPYGSYEWEAINHTRLNPSTGAAVDTWNFPLADSANTPFPNMRHCAILEGGHCDIAPGNTTRLPLANISWPSVAFDRLGTSRVVVAVAYDGTRTRYGPTDIVNNRDIRIHVGPTVLLMTDNSNVIYASKATSLAALKSGTTFQWWDDPSNNRVWVSVVDAVDLNARAGPGRGTDRLILYIKIAP